MTHPQACRRNLKQVMQYCTVDGTQEVSPNLKVISQPLNIALICLKVLVVSSHGSAIPEPFTFFGLRA